MTCPLCNHSETRVVRTSERAQRIRRTRQCQQCGNRWATLEITEEEANRVEHVKRVAGELLQALGDS